MATSGVPWQRCQFHLQQNASQYVPRQGMKQAVAADIRAIFNAPNRAQAEAQLRNTVSIFFGERWQKFKLFWFSFGLCVSAKTKCA